MSLFNKHQPSTPSQSNSFRLASHSSTNKSVPSSFFSNMFTPPLFSGRTPSPGDALFNTCDKSSGVIQSVLKYQGGKQCHNLNSAPCKDNAMAGCPPAKLPVTKLSHKTGQGIQLGQRRSGSTPGCQKGQGLASGRDGVRLNASTYPTKSNALSNKESSVFNNSYCHSKTLDKSQPLETSFRSMNFSSLQRPFFFPSYETPDQRSHASPPDKHQLSYAQQDSFDLTFGSSLSPPVTQLHSPLATGMATGMPPSGPQAPGNKNLSSSSIPFGHQGQPYVVNFSGDHSVTLGLRDGAEGFPGSGHANYTYHCLMEPSGTQGRLVLEPCGSQRSNSPSFSVGGFTGVKGQEDQCRRDTQAASQPRAQPQTSHYGPPPAPPTATPLSDRKPRRLRLVVTDGTVDLDLQYTD